jgi:VanZ family protein
MQFRYGSPQEKWLVAGAFLLGSAASAALLAWQGLFALPYLWLSLYLLFCSVLILWLPLPRPQSSSTRDRLYRALPALLFMIAIFLGSSYHMPSGLTLDVKDTYLHFTEYLGLGVLTARMVDPLRERRRPLATVVLALGIVAAYGALDEIHQAYVPGRTPDFGDLAWDVAGGLTGVAAYTLFARRQRVTSP